MNVTELESMQFIQNVTWAKFKLAHLRWFATLYAIKYDEMAGFRCFLHLWIETKSVATQGYNILLFNKMIYKQVK